MTNAAAQVATIINNIETLRHDLPDPGIRAKPKNNPADTPATTRKKWFRVA